MKYFFDTEFIERGPDRPILFLSIGIIAEDGRELYLEHPSARDMVNNDHVEFGDRWLIDNVRPHLQGGVGSGINPFYRRDTAAEIIAFCNPETYGTPEFWAYFADYDWVVLCQRFGRMIDLPKGWPMWCRDLKQLMADRGVKRDELPAAVEPEHHALSDARWTKRAYESVMARSSGEYEMSEPRISFSADWIEKNIPIIAETLRRAARNDRLDAFVRAANSTSSERIRDGVLPMPVILALFYEDIQEAFVGESAHEGPILLAIKNECVKAERDARFVEMVREALTRCRYASFETRYHDFMFAVEDALTVYAQSGEPGVVELATAALRLRVVQSLARRTRGVDPIRGEIVSEGSFR